MSENKASISSATTMGTKDKETKNKEVTFDADEAFASGYIPLDRFQSKLKTALEKADTEIEVINFRHNGYCTDAVLKCIATTLKNAKSRVSTLKEINLQGCSLVSDVGLYWLADFLADLQPLSLNVKLDGCTSVTNAGLLLLTEACSTCRLSAMATSVTHLSHLTTTAGCPLLTTPSSLKTETRKVAQLLMVPLKTNYSMAQHLSSNTKKARDPMHYIREALLQDWTVNLLEVEPDTPLFEQLVTDNLMQVVIPFNSSCEVTEVKNHISSVISLVLSKEKVNPAHQAKAAFVSSSDNFFTPYTTHMCRLSNDGTFQSLTDSERVIGLTVSCQPLSRTNPFYEVQSLGETKHADTGMVVGIMRDLLLGERYPMESKESSGGVVDGFEFEPGTAIGFGVEGEWLSEYVPSNSASFYFTKNGVKMSDKTLSDRPHIGMYPMLSVVGKRQAASKIRHFNSLPEPVLLDYEQRKLYHTQIFSHNVLCDENGVITYQDSNLDRGGVGLFVVGEGVSKQHSGCTIKILSTGNKGTITLGVGPENYPLKNQPGWKENSLALHGDNGGIYNNSGSVSSRICAAWKVGDKITISVSGLTGDYVNKGDTLQVKFSLNGKELPLPEQKITYEANTGIRCVFLIGMHSKGEKIQLMNYRPLCLPLSPMKHMLTMGRCQFMNIMDDGTLTYRKLDNKDTFSLFVSKTPVSSHLLYFEIEVVKLSASLHLGIGLCYSRYKANGMIGWYQGSLGYHADNGHLYHNTSTGIPPLNNAKVSYQTGDVVGCGIDIASAKLKSDGTGTLEPQQMLKVYFTKNGKRVHEREFEYLTEGLFPAVNMHYEGDIVRLLNYYSGPESVFSTLESTANAEKKGSAREKRLAFTEGCHFLVVGVAEDGSDPAGKTELVRQAFDLQSNLPAFDKLKAEISRIESYLRDLDLQGQQLYSQLLWQKECLQR